MPNPGLPLLIVVEGENDISFLKAISRMVHRENCDLPDLTGEQRIIFMPTNGSNLKEWVRRIAGLHMRAFFLFDREQEPETSQRREIVDAVNSMPCFSAAMTSKRTVENYLHPLSIQQACGIELSIDDDTDVSGLLALKVMSRNGMAVSWSQLPSKRQRRLHEKAKKILNLKAVQHMTPALLAERDAGGEVVGWLRQIGQMVETPIHFNEMFLQRPLFTFSDRELATVLAALRFWQQNLTDIDEVCVCERFSDCTPLTFDEIDDLCERMNCGSSAA